MNTENKIHPTAIIEGDVDLGKNNEIGPYCVLKGPLKIGNDNLIGPHVTIGVPGADTRNPRYDSTNKLIKIGSHNIIREFTAIQKPCYRDSTKLGNYIYLMQGASISHDVIIEDKVVVTANVVVAGLAHLLTGANLAMSCTINQYAVIGQYSIVATGAAALKNVRPFSRYIPGQATSVNQYAINKFGFEDYKKEIEDYVLNRIRPANPQLESLIVKFEHSVRDSKLETY
jgi:UDP-N-acetylglucosamine acyltransferase